MFNKKNIEAYYFIDKINDSTISTISKFKNISLIYLNHNDTSFLNTEDLNNIKKFCNKNNIKFYLTDNIRLAIKFKANGVYLTKNYNRMLHNFNYKKEFLILGSVHNQLEYYQKKIQNCKKFFLSPIFYNKKYSINRILGVIKFKIISKDWKNEAIPLSGINQRNIKKAILANKNQIAFRSWK
jgi:thiamine-phosphate pyrophosphorylase